MSNSSVLSLFSLQGKHAAVTGCTRGIGRAMALALAEAGAGKGKERANKHMLRPTYGSLIA